MALKKIGSEIIFGTTMIWAEKLNYHRGLPRSQQNPKVVHIWYEEQPFSGFGKKQKGLWSKRRFKSKCNFLILPKGGQKDVFSKFLKIK